MLMHTDLRPFRCMLCSFSTTRWDKLREHSSKFHQVLLRRRDVHNIEPGLDLNNTLSNVIKLATNAVLSESGPSAPPSAVPQPGPPPLPLPLPQYVDQSIAAEMDAQGASDEAAANAQAAGADEVAGSVLHLLHSAGADEFGQSPLLPSELGGPSNMITVNPPSHFSPSSSSAALNASDMISQQPRMFTSSSATAPIVIKRPQGGIIQKIPILSGPVPFLLANSQTEEATASDLDAEFDAAGPSDVPANSRGPTLATITTPIQSAQLLRDPQTGQLVMEYKFPSAGLQRWHNILKSSNIEPSDAALEAGEEGEAVEPPRRRGRRHASRLAFGALAQSDSLDRPADEGEPIISEHEVEGAEVIDHLHDLGDEEGKANLQRQREGEPGQKQKPEDEEPDMDLVARKCHKCPGCCTPSEKKRQHRRRRPPVLMQQQEQEQEQQQQQLQQPQQQYASMPPAANTFSFSTEQETRITPRDKANISNVDDIFIYQEQEVAGEETVPGASQLQQLRSAMRALPGGQEVAIVSPPSEGQLDPGQGSREIHVHTSTECTTLRLPTQAYQEIRILGNQIVIQLRNEDYTVHLTDLEGLPTQA